MKQRKRKKRSGEGGVPTIHDGMIRPKARLANALVVIIAIVIVLIFAALLLAIFGG
ncbi:MAG: hypothetical protein ACK55O_05700 [Phycisphaerales bacterium]|jgi:hypothetical protein|nr:hypothetical protein [Phycisphaeraceae bacterium]